MKTYRAIAVDAYEPSRDNLDLPHFERRLNEVARKGYRVVALAGPSYEPDGTMNVGIVIFERSTGASVRRKGNSDMKPSASAVRKPRRRR